MKTTTITKKDLRLLNAWCTKDDDDDDDDAGTWIDDHSTGGC